MPEIIGGENLSNVSLCVKKYFPQRHKKPQSVYTQLRFLCVLLVFVGDKLKLKHYKNLSYDPVHKNDQDDQDDEGVDELIIFCQPVGQVNIKIGPGGCRIPPGN